MSFIKVFHKQQVQCSVWPASECLQFLKGAGFLIVATDDTHQCIMTDNFKVIGVYCTCVHREGHGSLAEWTW